MHINRLASLSAHAKVVLYDNESNRWNINFPLGTSTDRSFISVTVRLIVTTQLNCRNQNIVNYSMSNLQSGYSHGYFFYIGYL